MATPITDGHAIVVTGAWNIRIFSPEWVASHLAPDTEVGLGVAIGNPTAPIRLQFRGIYLRVGAERLVFQPVDLTDEALETMQEAALTIIDMLPHTPMTAVGVNFQYLVSEPQGTLLNAFVHADNGALADFGAQVESTTIRRSTRLEGKALNLILALREDRSATVEFNNHTAVASAEEAKQALNVPILELRNRSIEAMRILYGLEVANYDEE